jgi:hypothetical protein
LIEIKDQIGRIDVNVGAARKTSREARSHSMEAQNPFEAVRTVMLDNLEKMGGATQRYLDAVETTSEVFRAPIRSRSAPSRHILSGKLQ